MLKNRVLVLFAVLFLSCLVVGIRAQAIKCNSGTNALLGLDNPFPNEAEGFKFYNRGKLTGITIASSKIDEVREIFGTPLKTSPSAEHFDYDSDWKIIFYYFTKSDKYEEFYGKNTYGERNYFSDDKENEGATTNNDVVVKKRFVIKPENIGLITAIEFIPKKNISLNPNAILEKSSQVNTYTRESYKLYRVSNGLSYEVFDRETGRLMNSAGEVILTYSRGDIMQIRYDYPCILNKSGFFSQIQ
jgi:hypothetical protein